MSHEYAAFPTRRWAFMAAALCVVLVALFLKVDMALALKLHAWSTPLSEGVFNAIDELGSSELYLVPALVLYIWALWTMRSGRAMPFAWDSDRVARASLFLITTMALGGIITVTLKSLVARARPELLFEKGLYGLGAPFSGVADFNSFPSSHTQAAFAAAAALAILAPRWRIPLMVVASAVATARVVNLDHYLSDVLAAAFIAIASAAIMAPLILNRESRWPLRTPWRWFAQSV